MRVLFINTQDIKGGAAIVVERLRTVLERNYQIETSLMVGNKLSARLDIQVTRTHGQQTIEKAIHKISNVMGMQYQYFPFSSKAILQYVQEYKPDVVSIHNTHGGYFETRLVEIISQFAPVVWTLHDMWSFTGNAAHTFGDESWKNLQNSEHLTTYYPAIGLNMGPWLLRQKKDIYGRANLSIVTPSRWLQDLATQSPVFQGKRVEHINNGVDLDVFSPDKRDGVRASLGIDEHSPVIMFSAENLAQGIWKGGADLLEVLRIIDEGATQPIHLLMIGEGVPGNYSQFKNLKARFTGYISDASSMANYLAASDVFLYPTKADNLPNVLVEAIACGTPCVTFNVGGCSEIIRNEYNGIVVDPGDFIGMARATLSLLTDPATVQMRNHAREWAVENFSISQMGAAYHHVFEARINNA